MNVMKMINENFKELIKEIPQAEIWLGTLWRVQRHYFGMQKAGVDTSII